MDGVVILFGTAMEARGGEDSGSSAVDICNNVLEKGELENEGMWYYYFMIKKKEA